MGGAGAYAPHPPAQVRQDPARPNPTYELSKGSDFALGLGDVVKTGPLSEIGRIGRAVLARVDEEEKCRKGQFCYTKDVEI